MRIDAATAFTLGDLAVFDATHLRQVIGDISGAASPALVGRAFADDGARETPPLDDLAERIERALPSDDRAAFAQARRRPVTPSERASAQRSACWRRQQQDQPCHEHRQHYAVVVVVEGRRAQPGGP